jgi:acyl-CoA reductase-like NAD-dependent aldehyde dehydrogenase
LYNKGMESTLAAPPPPVKREDPLAPAVIARMRKMQIGWGAMTMPGRLIYIRRLRHLLAEMRDEFCAATSADLHKPPAETLAGELLPVASACRFLEKRAASLLKPRKVSWFDTPLWLLGERDRVHRKPRGLVGIIGTWNYPIFLNCTQIVQALAAGNVVIWKPSEVAPRTAEVITRWLRAAMVDSDLVHVLPAEREWGQKLAEADVDHIVFTGHDVTGRKLAARLGERLISSTLELSGHDAVIVCHDANINLTAQALRFGVTMNAGQTCVAARRVFVQGSVYDRLQAELKPLFAAEPARPLAQRQQAGHVNGLIQDALNQGARLLTPTRIPAETDAGYPPVVVVDATPDMAICNEAIFAPVVVLIPYNVGDEHMDDHDAIEGIRQSDYGLGLSIFTADLRRAQKMAEHLPAGLITINDIVAPVAHPATPFGGVGRSGWGVTQGAEGLLEMTVHQVISHRTGTWRPHFDPPDTTPLSSTGVLDALLRWQHSRTFGERWRGFWAMVRAARQARRKGG